MSTWDEDVIETNTVTKEDEDAFLRDALGKYVDTVHSSDEPTKRKFEYKPLHESVTERYYTGERELVAMQDLQGGHLWHCKMIGGGSLPNDLEGQFTNEQEARAAIKLYILKKASE